MDGQRIVTTHDVDELLISTVVRLLQRRAFPNLLNIIAKTHSADIARWFPRLRSEEKISLTTLLIQEGLMGEVLCDLNTADIGEFLDDTKSEVIAKVLGVIPADDVARILSDLDEKRRLKYYNLLDACCNCRYNNTFGFQKNQY